jgi:transketolase
MTSGAAHSGHAPQLCARIKETARRVRCHIFRTLDAAGEGHLGGPLSAVEMLCALYFHHMRVDPSRPKWEGRDRFVLSKGHGAVALYATLAEAGYFPKEELLTFRQIGGRLAGHPDMKKTPGVDMSSGSLGIGISTAVGMAIGGKLRNADWRVYCMIGDGESQSGEVWEAAMAAAHYQLDNLTVMLDSNRLQVDGFVQDVMNLEPLRAKWEAFGWRVQEVDGRESGGLPRHVPQPRPVHGSAGGAGGGKLDGRINAGCLRARPGRAGRSERGPDRAGGRRRQVDALGLVP